MDLGEQGKWTFTSEQQRLSFRVTASSQAKGTKFTSFLTHIRNEVDFVPLACEDGVTGDQRQYWGNR